MGIAFFGIVYFALPLGIMILTYSCLNQQIKTALKGWANQI